MLTDADLALERKNADSAFAYTILTVRTRLTKRYATLSLIAARNLNEALSTLN